jgi:hypothetical protein
MGEKNLDLVYRKAFNSAKKYKRRGHFQVQDKNNYMLAYDYGILDLVCSHMEPKHKNLKWDLKSLKKEAKKYKRRGEFQKKSRSAYITAYVGGLLDEVCAHMPYTEPNKPNKDLDFKKIKKIALSYPRISEFCIKNMGLYYKLKRNNKYELLKSIHKKYYKDTSER